MAKHTKKVLKAVQNTAGAPQINRPTPAIIITIVAGVLILFGSIVGMVFYSLASPSTLAQLCTGAGINMTQNMTSSMAECAQGVDLIYGTGIICGAIVAICGIKMRSGSIKTINKMGGIALAFSLASIFSGGGIIIGLALGVTGGLIALLYKG